MRMTLAERVAQMMAQNYYDADIEILGPNLAPNVDRPPRLEKALGRGHVRIVDLLPSDSLAGDFRGRDAVVTLGIRQTKRMKFRRYPVAVEWRPMRSYASRALKGDSFTTPDHYVQRLINRSFVVVLYPFVVSVNPDNPGFKSEALSLDSFLKAPFWFPNGAQRTQSRQEMWDHLHERLGGLFAPTPPRTLTDQMLQRAVEALQPVRR